jgi:hypothetical protein
MPNIKAAVGARNAVAAGRRLNSDTVPRYVAAGLVGGAVYGNAPSYRHARGPEQRQRARTVTGGALGAAAGEGLWNASGFGVRGRGHQLERERPENMSRSQHQKLMARHHHMHGVPQNTKPSKDKQPAFFREYPRGLPASKYKRTLGHMSGRKGKALEAATVGTLGLLGAHSARGQRVTASKALYQRDSRVSLVRGAEFAVGAGLLASGAGRSRMIGTALGRGVRIAQKENNHLAVEALQRAQAAQGVLRRGVQPTERQVRQIQAVDQAVRRVPRHLRPAVAMGAGALLMGNATPIRTTTYRPVAAGW